jgi:hypothetical protein
MDAHDFFRAPMNNAHPDRFLSDELFRQVVEAEVDAIDDSLTPDERERCVVATIERMQAELLEGLMTGDLQPDAVNVHIHAQVTAILRGEPGSLAA